MEQMFWRQQRLELALLEVRQSEFQTGVCFMTSSEHFTSILQGLAPRHSARCNLDSQIPNCSSWHRMGKELPCHKDVSVKCRWNVVSRKVVWWQMGKGIFVYKQAVDGSAVVQKNWGVQVCSILAHLNLSITPTSSVEIHLACLTLISWAALQVNAELLEITTANCSLQMALCCNCYSLLKCTQWLQHT